MGAWSWGVLVVRFGSGTQANMLSKGVSQTLHAILFSDAILYLLKKGFVLKYGLVRGVTLALEGLCFDKVGVE
jgi:hypothetical protein